MQRARQADAAGRCRREVPVTLARAGDELVDGVVDLAFEEDLGWTVVDFKTDRELDPGLEVYRRQLALYAAAVSAATGRDTTALLVRI